VFVRPKRAEYAMHTKLLLVIASLQIASMWHMADLSHSI